MNRPRFALGCAALARLLVLLVALGRAGPVPACTEIAHCWFDLASASDGRLGVWAAADVMARVEGVLASGVTRVGWCLRDGGAGLAAEQFASAASGTRLDWRRQAAAGGILASLPAHLDALVELQPVAGSGHTLLRVDPYSPYGPTLRSETKQTAVVRYLAFGPEGQVCGIDELNLGESLVIDWNWHGFMPLGGLLLRRVEVFAGVPPLLAACWLATSLASGPASAPAMATVASGSAYEGLAGTGIPTLTR